jgi:isochorismate synthase
MIYSANSNLKTVISIIIPFNERPFTAPCCTSSPYRDSIYWRSPKGKVRVLALGDCWSVELSGTDRFREAESHFNQLIESWDIFNHLDSEESSSVTPRVLFQYAFSEKDPMNGEWSNFPNTVLKLPKLQLLNENGIQSIIFSHTTDNSSSQIMEEWESLLQLLQQPPEVDTDNTKEVEFRATEIKSNSSENIRLIERAISTTKDREDREDKTEKSLIQKLVIGQQKNFIFPSKISSERTLKNLESSSPESAQFAFSNSTHTFIASPPEKLFSKRGNIINSDALAGTVQRGSSLAEEAELESKLLTSKKLNIEHRIVVDAVRNSLASLCRNQNSERKPKIRKLGNIQHLLTSITGELQDSVSIFKLIETLHQSPAICGTPRADSFEWLENEHNSNRGAYCGGAGWIDSKGDGEIHVLLRCAMIEQDRATIYAGAGIVDGSKSRDEQQEIDLKISGVLDSISG